MRLLCGAELSEEDVEAIRKGHEQLADVVARRMKVRLGPPRGRLRPEPAEGPGLAGRHRAAGDQGRPAEGADGHPLPASVTEATTTRRRACSPTPRETRSASPAASTSRPRPWSTTTSPSWSSTPGRPARLRRSRSRAVRQALVGQGAGLDRHAHPRGGPAELLKIPPERPAYARRSGEARAEEEKPPSPRPGDRRRPARADRLPVPARRAAPPRTPTRSAWRPAPSGPGPTRSGSPTAVVERFPHRFMLCDEVGLGKTIEAGLAIRQLLLSGRVRRALILVPKSVLVQWQEELYEKFVLNIPRYDGQTFRDVFDREMKAAGRHEPLGQPSRSCWRPATWRSGGSASSSSSRPRAGTWSSSMRPTTPAARTSSTGSSSAPTACWNCSGHAARSPA